MGTGAAVGIDVLDRAFVVLTLIVALPCAVARASTAPVDASKLPAAVDRRVDFARDVQPILAKSCYGCHGPEKHKSGYRLDVKSIALKGGDIGGAIIAGNGAASPLIHYVAGIDDDMLMPPKGERLTAEQIGILRAWIDQGAIWPDDANGPRVKDKADHWAFKPATRPVVPVVDGVAHPIDAFIRAAIARKQLKPSSEADRRTLIRRLSFDLTGLPPTPAEVEAFLADGSPGAYEKLVDRLLASPRYGERWGRHWLDVVHFGETHGYDKDKPRPNAWPYRDYVIRALNEDKPYSRFVKEQLAGDVLYPSTADGIVATGFIAAGPWDFVGHVELREGTSDKDLTRSNDRDDMVMTTMSTFQSLTVHCARCHNHKFDPITQEDYYRLQAVFAGVDRGDRPYDTEPGTAARRQQLLAERASIEARLAAVHEAVAKVSSPAIEKLDARIAKLRPTVAGAAPSEGGSPSNGYHSAIEPTPDAAKWVQVELPAEVAIEHVTLVPARPTDFADTPGFGFPLRFKVELADAADFASPATLADHAAQDFANPGSTPLTVLAGGKRGRVVRVTATRLWERHRGGMDFVFALGELQVWSGGRNVALGAGVTSADSIEAGRWSRRFLVDGYDSRGRIERAHEAHELRSLEDERRALAAAQLDEPSRAALKALPERLAALQRDIAALPPPSKVYAAVPLPKPRPVHLLARGDVKHPKQLMAAGSLEVFAGKDVSFAITNVHDEGSRRAALAEWLTNERNLLTRRSIVNRVWHYHFGNGIIDSPNDFGHMGGTPSHPELLDWLAYWFQDHGESLKALHRLIVTSATYRQSSAANRAYETIDADNRYLWRMNRTRLDAESLRDAMLAASGTLDESRRGGPSDQQFAFKDGESPVYDYANVHLDAAGPLRRSVYRFIVRSVPDPFMDTLDCPDPSVLAPKRNTTLTALQALSLLNNPFVLRHADQLAARVAKESADVAVQAAAVYRLTLGRHPTAQESKMMIDYTRRFGMANACRMIFNSNEFVFVD